MRTLLYFLLFYTAGVSAQLSKKHWIPPIHARDGESYVEDHYVYLSTPETIPFQVTITFGNGTPIAGSPFTISSGNPIRVTIGNGQPSNMFVSKNDVNIVKSGKGLILEGTNDFYATFKVRAQNHAEILVAKGYQAIGQSFRLGGLPQTWNGGIRNFFASFMATEDATTITVSDYDTNVEFVTSGTATITSNTQTFNLNAGQTVVVSGYTDVPANLSGFIGALVTSNKPIAVNTGNALAGMATPDEGQDFTFDQIVPYEEVGTEYAVVKANGSDNVELPLVIATQDNTTVFINGSPTAFTTLNAGEYSLIPTSYYQGVNNKNMYITSDKPVYLYQILGGSSYDATSGLNFIPPLSCYFQKSVDLIPSINSIGNTTYVSEIMAVTYTGSTLTINGNPVTALPEPILGNPQWSTYRIPGYTGNVKVESTGPLAVGLFGASGAVGFGGYYSGFGSEPRDTDAAVCSNKTTNLFDLIEGNPDPGGTWTPALASGTGVFDPNIDAPGLYVYNFTGLCEIVNVSVNVSIQQALNPGISTQTEICANDASFDLFPLLGTTAQSGGTWSPALANGNSIFNPSVDLSGIYTYTLNGNDVCDSVSATINVVVQQTPSTNTISDYEICDDNADGDDSNGSATFDLESKRSEILNGQNGVALTFHETEVDAISGANPIVTTFAYQNSTPSIQTIFVRLENTITHCFTTTRFNLVVHALPSTAPEITLKQCDDNQDAISSFNLYESNVLITSQPNLTFTYYTSLSNAQTGSNPINNPTAFVTPSTTIWVRSTTVQGCYRISKLNLVITATQIPTGFEKELNVCDVLNTSVTPADLANDGFAYFDLNTATADFLAQFNSNQNLTVTYYENSADALAELNAIATTSLFKNTIANTQMLYVRIDSNINNDCVGLGPYLKLTVDPIPEVNLGNDFILCVNPQTSYGFQTIDATPFNGGTFTYQWSPTNPNIDANGNESPFYTITAPGNYSVVVTNSDTNCQNSDSIIATLSSEPVTVIVNQLTPLFHSGLTTIEAVAQGGFGVYEYSIDGINWQSSGIFTGLSNGNYTVLVRDIEGCGVKASHPFFTVSYANFFTPNGDGYNDYWTIENLPASFQAKIYIFDRYGKLLKEITPYSRGWDGIYNGEVMPSTDYWFKVEYIENNILKEFKSHFALKR